VRWYVLHFEYETFFIPESITPFCLLRRAVQHERIAVRVVYPLSSGDIPLVSLNDNLVSLQSPMRILFYDHNTKLEPWLAGLRAALPGAEVLPWEPGMQAADYAVVWSPPQALVDEQPQLRALFNMGAGVDALLALRVPAQTLIVRLDDAGMGVQMAEYVTHAVLRHVREFAAYEAAQRKGHWAYRRPLRPADFPIGLMGLGVLGQRVARALVGFDWPLMGWSRSAHDVPGVRCFHGPEGLHEFLAATRILVCLLPLTPETRDILNRDTLGRLQPGAVLIHVARGGHLVEEDLLALLDEGHLAAATLDVFRTEPLPSDHPFWQHPKITVTPHMSARTLRDETIAQIAHKIGALQRGQAIAGVVQRARGY